jgi:multidrug efflux system membrane fusion protein
MTDAPDTPRNDGLNFESDAGSSRPKWIAGGVVLLMVAWMGSGFILPTKDTDTQQVATPPKAVSVGVVQSQSQPVDLIFVAEGQALPDRDSTILAQAGGQISELSVEKGDRVVSGQPIATVEQAARQADLERAQEALDQATREQQNAETLVDRGVATVDRLVESQTALAAAQASVVSARQALQDTVIRAPFDGRIETLTINAGELVAAGGDVGRIVDNTPLTIEIQIPQQALSRITKGLTAQVHFITGEQRQGVVRYVGTSADNETRTFTADIEVPNADGVIPAGLSAQVKILTGQQPAHFVSPSTLSLNPDGALGIKTVGEGQKVRFTPVEIARAQTDGIWISGLPERADIITIGQGFVNDGEVVDPQPAADLDPGTRTVPPVAMPDQKADAGDNAAQVIVPDAGALE